MTIDILRGVHHKETMEHNLEKKFIGIMIIQGNIKDKKENTKIDIIQNLLLESKGSNILKLKLINLHLKLKFISDLNL